MKILVEVQDNKAEQFIDTIKNFSFVEKVQIEANAIVNERILKSIESYETGKVKPTPFSLAELKEMIDA